MSFIITLLKFKVQFNTSAAAQSNETRTRARPGNNLKAPSRERKERKEKREQKRKEKKEIRRLK